MIAEKVTVQFDGTREIEVLDVQFDQSPEVSRLGRTVATAGPFKLAEVLVPPELFAEVNAMCQRTKGARRRAFARIRRRDRVDLRWALGRHDRATWDVWAHEASRPC